MDLHRSAEHGREGGVELVYLWCDGQVYLIELWRIYTPPFWTASAEKAG